MIYRALRGDLEIREMILCGRKGSLFPEESEASHEHGQWPRNYASILFCSYSLMWFKSNGKIVQLRGMNLLANQIPIAVMTNVAK